MKWSSFQNFKSDWEGVILCKQLASTIGTVAIVLYECLAPVAMLHLICSYAGIYVDWAAGGLIDIITSMIRYDGPIQIRVVSTDHLEDFRN